MFIFGEGELPKLKLHKAAERNYLGIAGFDPVNMYYEIKQYVTKKGKVAPLQAHVA